MPQRMTPEQQATRIEELEKRNAHLEARLGHEQVVTMQDREAQLQRHIQELRSRVAVLKKIAEGGRAAMLACAEGLYGIDDDHLIEARRQLAKEHPEAF